MTTIRTKKKKNNFVILEKSCLKEPGMSWAAKGLHAYLMSLPEDWEINTYDLTKRSKNGRDAVRALLIELEHFYYLSRETVRTNGKFEKIVYMIYETPQLPEPEHPALDNPVPDYPGMENPTEVNNKYNKYQDNKIITAAANHKNEDSYNTPTITAAAAASENKIYTAQQNDSNDPPQELATQSTYAESLINEILTATQIHKVKVEVQILKCDMAIENPEQLIDEICQGILDTNCFSKIGNNFHRKLKAISNSIRNRSWETPVLMAHRLQKQHQAEIKELKQTLGLAESQVKYCNEMIAHSKIHKNLERHKFEAEKLQHEAIITEIKEKLHKVISAVKKS